MNLASIYLLFKIIKEHVIVIEINIMIVFDVFKSNFNYDGIAQQFKKTQQPCSQITQNRTFLILCNNLMIYSTFYRTVTGSDSRWEIYGSQNIYLFTWRHTEKMVPGSLCALHRWMWDYDVTSAVCTLLSSHGQLRFRISFGLSGVVRWSS